MAGETMAADRAARAFFGALSWLVRSLPPASFGAVASLLTAVRGLSRRDVRVLRQNLPVVLGLPPGSPEARRLERRCVHHQIVAALETLRISVEPARLNVEAMPGFDEFRRLMAEAEAHGRGQVLVTAHFGAWELLAHSTVRAAARPVCAVAKPAPHPAASRFVERMRARAGIGVIWSGRASLLRDMLSCLGRQETLIMVADQRPDQRRGPEVDFLGRRTEFVAGPAALASKRDCPLLAVFCIREGPITYRLESEILRLPGGTKDRVELAQRVAAAMEGRIRSRPEQWMWNYRRWHYQPDELAAAGIGKAASRS